MFDLDTAIASWRATLTYNRTFTADDLDELEQHVRDQVTALGREGVPAKEAFRQTLGEMGSYGEAEAEYRKVYWGKLRRRHQLTDELAWRLSMLKNYLKIVLRNVKQHPGYTFINVAGLAVGIACCLLIFSYVRDELSFDRFHENADSIYRLISVANGPDGARDIALSRTPEGPALVQEFSEVRKAVRLFQFRGDRSELIQYGDQRFRESGIFFVDSTFFDVFSFSFLKGVPETALVRPNTVVLTESMARKYFGDADPLGETIQLGIRGTTLEVTGVVEDVSPRSHLQFNFLGSFASLSASARADNWVRIWLYTYILLEDDARIDRLETKLPDYIAKYNPDLYERYRQGEGEFPLRLQPLVDIHFDNISGVDLNYRSGDRRTVYTFSIIGVFILFIACINFVNLALALAANRAREVGIRKVAGAVRRQLVVQFLAETVSFSLAASLLAFGLAHAVLPVFNTLAERTITLGGVADPTVWGAVLGASLLVGVAAGGYPAFVLSAFRPAAVLKGGLHRGGKGVSLRRILVVFQFSISTFLLIGTGILYDQLGYFHSKNLGFDKEQVVLIPIQDTSLRGRFKTIKQAFARHPNVVAASGIQSPPGADGLWRFVRAGESDDTGALWKTYHGDFDYVDLMGMTIVAGRSFSESFGTDTTDAVLLNEAAVRALGWDSASAIGRRIVADDQENTIIGVVQDFHHASLHEPITPLVIALNPNTARVLAVRILPTAPAETLADLERLWKEWDTAYPFVYSFLDEDFARKYRNEETMGQLFGYFAALAIFIACLGLFGMAAHTAERRTKEIGVRKVLGASVASILIMLSKDFTRMVGLALLIAAPLAYLVMNRWLQDFAYRIEIGPGVFLQAGGSVLLMALLTISYHAIQAATTNPVSALRYE